MRWWILLSKVTMLGAVALATGSCGASTGSQRDNTLSSGFPSIEDSGKRLSGDFVVSSLEDSYAPKKAPTQAQAVFSFDESGIFKKQDKSRTEEGSYVIGTQGELVIYAEKVNGEPLPAARVERYSMSDQRDDGFTLQSGGSRKVLLRKR
jgi:hypothetical protein